MLLLGLPSDVFMAALWNMAGHYILSCGSFFFFLSLYLSFFLACSQPSQIGCIYHTSTQWCGLGAKLGCRLKRAARGSLKYRTQKITKIRHLRTIAQLCRAISSQLRHMSTIGKKLLNSNISPTCPHNMANFGPLAAEIGSLVWGTPAHFNRFRVLASLLYQRR